MTEGPVQPATERDPASALDPLGSAVARRRFLVGAAGVTAAGWAAPQVFSVPAAAAQSVEPCTLPQLLPPCEGPECPDIYGPPGPYTTPIGRDAAVNVFVGGDLSVTADAAEAEGRVVVLGNMSVAKTQANAVYNVGVVGVGSGVVPPNGSDFLIVGGDLTVAAGQTLITGTAAAFGVTSYGGTLSGSVDVAGGSLVSSTTATDPYLDLPTLIGDTSACWAAIPATGTAVNESFRTVFTGDGVSALQVFNVPFDLEGPGGSAQSIEFSGIPIGATVLVNMTASGSQTINSFGSNDDTWFPVRQRLVWNFTNATSPVLLTGPVDYFGAVVVASPASTSTVEVPAVNGRFYAAGSVIHTSRPGGGGEEFHNYAFLGTIPPCPCP